ncbi:interactor of constitutive active ROPs 2, chloroplastic-like isoform X1 [Musa acuminata AAA Group]|uniref:interactor of constitutive active ROPs 2, chloroplastic-like isoform X1 n=2 Tax=Musa acuminata AAA Group TaxID=214697 RepID=UPI0031CF4F25
MQTPKPRSGSSEVPQRTSPITPRTRTAKSGDNECNSATSATSTRTSTERSPKVIMRRSPRSPVIEKKHPTRLSELETQICQLKEDAKKTREQLSSSETCKKRVQQEAEEAKKQLEDMSAKLDDSQRQLVEFSAAEEARLQELRKISQERDRAWQSELEAIQKQHTVDTAALGSAMNEIQKLKVQLEVVLKAEAAYLKQSETASTELQVLKQEMTETLATVESLKVQLRDSKKSEAEARALVDETCRQLEMSKTTIETLRSEGSTLEESFSAKASDFEESRTKVDSLEEVKNSITNKYNEEVHGGKSSEKAAGNPLVTEVEQLRSALEAAEIKYQADQIQSTMQVRSAYELMERVKSDCGVKETELKLALSNAKTEIAELKAKLVDKEAEHQQIADNKELSADDGEVRGAQLLSELESKFMKSTNDIAELKANLMDKETELQNILEENEMLKSEMSKREVENRRSSEAMIAELELSKAAEQDALIRLGYITEESDKNSRRAARVAEQLDAAQAVNSQMESELKRLRIQCDQWRKAAEAAASILSSSNNGGNMERTGSLDSDYNSIAGKLMSSPFSDDLNEESPKKKNSNVLRKIGGLWKKSQK